VYYGHVLHDRIRTTETLSTAILKAPRSLIVVTIATVTVMLLVAIFVSLVGEGKIAFPALGEHLRTKACWLTYIGACAVGYESI
jgi:hypothetical protein